MTPGEALRLLLELPPPVIASVARRRCALWSVSVKKKKKKKVFPNLDANGSENEVGRLKKKNDFKIDGKELSS